jgi:hypothetical protein
VASNDYAFLDSVSEHRDRVGDTSRLHPAFAANLASAIQDAQSQGLNVKMMSGFREPGVTGSAYDAGGNSSHTYGMASDIDGLDGPNGPKTKQWAQIAAAHGLYNPYGVDNAKEFNHWQMTPYPLETHPEQLAALKKAYASGDQHAIWDAGQPVSDKSSSDTPVDFRNSVYQTLIGKGLNAQQAMGAMYSLMGESGHGLDPSSYNANDPGGSMGFAQWNGPRRAGLQAVAKQMGVSETDPTAQLAYFKQELEGPYKGVIDNIKANATSAADATRIWTGEFEAPKVNNWQQRFAAGAQLGKVGDDGAPVWSTPAATTTTAPSTDAPVAKPPQTVGDALAAITKEGTNAKGDPTQSPLQQLGSAFSNKPQQQQQAAPPMLEAAPSDPGIIGPSQQLAATVMASAMKPLSWTSAAPGAGAGQQGLTLNSYGAPYG